MHSYFIEVMKYIKLKIHYNICLRFESRTLFIKIVFIVQMKKKRRNIHLKIKKKCDFNAISYLDILK